MIDIEKAKKAFKNFLNNYNKNELGFKLKIVHTYHVVDNAREIATKLRLPEEDIKLAELIALLHDIGRFEEIKLLKKFDSVKFDHASHGVKMLFENNLIRDFIEDDSYDEIIRVAIDNHSRLAIQEGLDEKCLLHSQIIRDADKLDNFRLKKEESIEEIFPGQVKSREDMENSTLSNKIYETIKNKKCVDIHDRVTPLDYWVCILAFTFDLNFKESYKIVKENNYIDISIDRFKYSDCETQKRIENIRNIINEYINTKLI